MCRRPTQLFALINHFKGTQVLCRRHRRWRKTRRLPDLKDIKGQETAKRALGDRGGRAAQPADGRPARLRQVDARRSACPALLPPLIAEEALEVSMIHSLAGLLPDGGLTRRRPFRDPHHSASLPALVGGGARAKPGEISLAHLGVLFSTSCRSSTALCSKNT